MTLGQRNYYSLENAEQVVDDFLKNVRLRLQSKGDIPLKCGFMIENIQPSLNENFAPIINTRNRSTKLHKTKYCNDYLFYGLRENILKRVIVNDMSSSSWRFRRFIYLNFKVSDLENEIVR